MNNLLNDSRAGYDDSRASYARRPFTIEAENEVERAAS